MDLRRFQSGRIPFRFAGRIGLCLGLTATVILALHTIRGMLQPQEIFVDIPQNIPANARNAESDHDSRNQLRFAIATMVSAEATFPTYRQLAERISRDVGRKTCSVVRPSYKDVRLELERGAVDVALVGTDTYVRAVQNNSIRLLVQPEFEERTSCRTLVIVPAESRFRTWMDLRGAVIAFADYESVSGWLLPSVMVEDLGQVPTEYFGKIIYTSNHDRSILAVFENTVDAAAVSSLAWSWNVRQRPALEKRTRIIFQSPDYGPPPIVVPRTLDPSLEQALAKAMLALHKDEEGRRILSAIGIRRFVPAQPETYASAIELYGRYQSRMHLSKSRIAEPLNEPGEDTQSENSNPGR